jgi:hypothetical protein
MLSPFVPGSKEMCIMADIINELASQSGISPEMAKKGLGMLLAAFQHALPAERFAKIEGAIPGADKLLTDAQAEESARGVLGSIRSLAGGLVGGGDAAALASHFGQLGFSSEQVSCFLPQVVDFLKGKLLSDLMRKITTLLPASMAGAAP